VSGAPDLLDVEALVTGLRDAMGGAESKLSEAEMGQLLQELQTKMRAAQQKQTAEQFAGNKKTGEDYLAANANQEGVKVLPSGLQYKVINPGTGRTPTAKDVVSTHYRGTFIDGNEFDSSYKRGEPAQFGVTQVIPGWTEALQLMKEGAKWELVIPYQLAYGEGGRAGIPPYSALKFEIELIKIVDQPKKN
jgi:FKBP-type peptidyl-prolyl cis-trans isomerase